MAAASGLSEAEAAAELGALREDLVAELRGLRVGQEEISEGQKEMMALLKQMAAHQNDTSRDSFRRSESAMDEGRVHAAALESFEEIRTGERDIYNGAREAWHESGSALPTPVFLRAFAANYLPPATAGKGGSGGGPGSGRSGGGSSAHPVGGVPSLGGSTRAAVLQALREELDRGGEVAPSAWAAFEVARAAKPGKPSPLQVLLLAAVGHAGRAAGKATHASFLVDTSGDGKADHYLDAASGRLLQISYLDTDGDGAEDSIGNAQTYTRQKKKLKTNQTN